MTCWRRLRDWNEAGVWQRLHEALLAELNAAARLDWSRAVVDSSHVRAPKGGSRRARRQSTGDWPAPMHHFFQWRGCLTPPWGQGVAAVALCAVALIYRRRALRMLELLPTPFGNGGQR